MINIMAIAEIIIILSSSMVMSALMGFNGQVQLTTCRSFVSDYLKGLLCVHRY